MHDLERNEDRLRGTYEFPFEFHHIENTHPRYVMSYHWHVEYEIIRILQGSLTVTLDEKSFKAIPGDVIFVHSGILHSGIPDELSADVGKADYNAPIGRSCSDRRTAFDNCGIYACSGKGDIGI